MELDLTNARLLTVAAPRLGDLLFCTPSYRYIKQVVGSVTLDVVVNNSLGKQTLSNNHYIDNLLEQENLSRMTKLESYDLALNLHDSPAAREVFAQLDCPVLDFCHAPHKKHQAEQVISALSAILKKPITDKSCLTYDLAFTEMDKSRVESLLARHNLSPKQTLVGLHIGCHGLNKSRLFFKAKLEHKKVWPLDNFIQLINQLHRQNPEIQFVLTGSANEKKLADKLMNHCRHVHCLMGETNTRELSALMTLLSCYVVSDTGACHVACANDVPLVALYRTSSIARTGPFPPRAQHTILHQDRVADVPVTDVVAAVANTLKSSVQVDEAIDLQTPVLL